MSRGSVHVVTGMGSIVNLENIDPRMTSLDLKQLEKSMIDGGLIQQKTKDPRDKFDEELKVAAKSLGISFGDLAKPKPAAPQLAPRVVVAPTPSRLPMVSMDGGYQPSQHSQHREAAVVEEVEEEEEEAEAEEEDAEEAEEEDDDDTPSTPSAVTADYGGSGGSHAYGDDRPRAGLDLPSYTLEKERRMRVDHIVGASDMGSGFSFEKEKREDLKCAMLAEIDNLISTLEEENVNLSRIPKVDSRSSYEDVEMVLKMLRHKNDHTRYCGFAEEFLLFGAYALEELFDGERVYFGRYSPDLTGWNHHLNVKLKRMQNDTSQIVSTVMQDYNIGPGARILLELIPNMVIYSRMRSHQHNDPGLYSEESMQDLTTNIRNL